jgi:hypothetical protein
MVGAARAYVFTRHRKIQRTILISYPEKLQKARHPDTKHIDLM